MKKQAILDSLTLCPEIGKYSTQAEYNKLREKLAIGEKIAERD